MPRGFNPPPLLKGRPFLSCLVFNLGPRNLLSLPLSEEQQQLRPTSSVYVFSFPLSWKTNGPPFNNTGNPQSTLPQSPMQQQA